MMDSNNGSFTINNVPIANSNTVVVVNHSTTTGRSPGLILLLASLALILISLQSMSEMSELLLQHVDDSLLEDGTLFAGLEITDQSPLIDEVNDYGEDDDVAPKDEHVDAKPIDRPFQTNDEPFEPSGDGTVSTDKEKITINVDFVYFTDRYGLIAPELTEKELFSIINDARETWLQANILLNFTIGSAPIPIDDVRADAYRWLVYGSKDQTKQKFWKDVQSFLRNGKSRMTTAQIRDILAKYYQLSGRPLIDWITSVHRKKNNSLFTVASLRYWPWNNGGQLGRKIFFRGGSCNSTQHIGRRLRKEEYIACNGWNIATQKQHEITVNQGGRILSHLIGHYFSLRHPVAGKCRSLERRSPLMCQPRRQIADPSFFLSRGLDEEEIYVARTAARTRASSRNSYQ
jgi:hypothetical protein